MKASSAARPSSISRCWHSGERPARRGWFAVWAPISMSVAPACRAPRSVSVRWVGRAGAAARPRRAPAPRGRRARRADASRSAAQTRGAPRPRGVSSPTPTSRWRHRCQAQSSARTGSGPSKARASASHQNSRSRSIAPDTTNIVAGTPAARVAGRLRGQIGVPVVEGHHDGPRGIWPSSMARWRPAAVVGRVWRGEDLEVLGQVVRLHGKPPRIDARRGRAVVEQDQEPFETGDRPPADVGRRASRRPAASTSLPVTVEPPLTARIPTNTG